MKKLQLLTITMLFALAGTNTAEARIGSVRSSMMNRLIAQQENQDGTTAAEGTTDVKLPGGSSISKMMRNAAKKTKDAATEGTTDVKLPGGSSISKMMRNAAKKTKDAATEGTTDVKLPGGSSISKMMRNAAKKTKDAATEGTTDVKLPGGSSISKMMGGSGSSMQKMIEKARDTASEGTISSSQITNIKNGLQKKVKMIVEMIQNSSKQNQVILEMVQSLDDIPKTSYDIGGNPTSNTLPEGARTLA